MKIVSAEFVVSAASVAGLPSPLIPEVAFSGKSNVGKSSLINSLLNRKNLVKTSATPGKTQMINFFSINRRFHLVDLPGYGFAKAPQEVRLHWEKLMSEYLLKRMVLRGVVLIMDARHDPGPLDLKMKAWLDSAGLPALVVANKVDKLKKSQIGGRLGAISSALRLAEPPVAYSARNGTGKEQLWRRVGALLEDPSPHPDHP